MNCQEAIRLIFAGMDEPASHEDPGLAAHLKVCDKCRAELRKLNRLDNVLRSIPEPDASRVRLEETVKAVSLEVCGKTNRGSAVHKRHRFWAAVATVIVIATGIGFLAGRLSVTAEEKAPALESPESPVQRTALTPVRQSEDKETAAAVEKVSRGYSDLLVDRLVQADLALSETDRPGDKAAIYCAMSRDLLLELEGTAGRSEVEETRLLAQGYTRLVRDGVLPNVMLVSEDEDLATISGVMDSLEGNCSVLALLVTGIKGREHSLLAEALSISENCLNAAKSRLDSK